MSGKLCFGTVLNNSFRIKESRAFSEGIYHRASGTALAFPITDNPHAVASSAAVAWDAGWTAADDASPAAIAQSAAPCVAVPTSLIAA